MLTITAPDIRQARARALCVAGGALAAALVWTVEVPRPSPGLSCCT